MMSEEVVHQYSFHHKPGRSNLTIPILKFADAEQVAAVVSDLVARANCIRRGFFLAGVLRIQNTLCCRTAFP